MSGARKSVIYHLIEGGPDAYTPVELSQIANEYLNGAFANLAQNLTDETLDQIRPFILQATEYDDSTYGSRLGYWKSVLAHPSGDLQWLEKQKEAVQELTAQDIKDFIKTNLLDAKKRASFSVYHFGAGKEMQAPLKEETLALDPGEYRKKAEKHHW